MGTRFSYFLRGVSRYDDLRTATVGIARILVVLFLPADGQEWLNHSDDELALRRCAYWETLCDAPASVNRRGETVYLPKAQTFTPQALSDLAVRLSRRDFPLYPAV